MPEKSSGAIRRGVCHLLGDDVSLDDGIIPARFAAQRVTDPAELIAHLFADADPQLAGKLRRGDIILAGRNFAGGKPRLQGLIALAALDLSLVCVSMPYKILRRAIARAIPVIVGAPDGRTIAKAGDELEIDCAAGLVRNLSLGTSVAVPPMPAILQEIIATGGTESLLRDWLARHPEQGATVA